jgi:hypothetical protein
MNTTTNIPLGSHNRKPSGMRTKTSVKAGALGPNHNETVAGFPVSSDLRAGVVPDAPDCH